MKYLFKTLSFLISLIAFTSFCNAEMIEEEVEEEIEIEEEIVEEEGDYTPFMLKPVVQFSCARYPTKQEDAWEKDLKGKNDGQKLSALGQLLSYPAPSSVPLQYKAYTELKDNIKTIK